MLLLQLVYGPEDSFSMFIARKTYPGSANPSAGTLIALPQAITALRGMCYR